jgi:hypothetical protein
MMHRLLFSHPPVRTTDLGHHLVEEDAELAEVVRLQERTLRLALLTAGVDEPQDHIQDVRACEEKERSGHQHKMVSWQVGYQGSLHSQISSSHSSNPATNVMKSPDARKTTIRSLAGQGDKSWTANDTRGGGDLLMCEELDLCPRFPP